MSDKEKDQLASEAIETYTPVEVGPSPRQAEAVRELINKRGFLGTKFEVDGTWYVQTA